MCKYLNYAVPLVVATGLYVLRYVQEHPYIDPEISGSTLNEVLLNTSTDLFGDNGITVI